MFGMKTGLALRLCEHFAPGRHDTLLRHDTPLRRDTLLHLVSADVNLGRTMMPAAGGLDHMQTNIEPGSRRPQAQERSYEESCNANCCTNLRHNRGSRTK